jgi:legumain
MRHREHLDGSMDLIGTFLYGPQRGSFLLNTVRQPGMPLVDDWGCLKSTVITTDSSTFDFVIRF